MAHRVDITIQGNGLSVSVNGRRVRPEPDPPAYDPEVRRRAFEALMKAEDKLREMGMDEWEKWWVLREKVNEAWERYHQKYGT